MAFSTYLHSVYYWKKKNIAFCYSKSSLRVESSIMTSVLEYQFCVCFCLKVTRFKGNLYIFSEMEMMRWQKWLNSGFPDHFYCWHFLITSSFEPLYFVKMCPIFVSSAFLNFKKYKNPILIPHNQSHASREQRERD